MKPNFVKRKCSEDAPYLDKGMDARI